ncbi:hypothetical protein [Litorimonas sp.]|jgi:type II secretory pathway pseudopilin PulG|uniref:hypothetical protein n=1 Tax=Litorimonas sp. TaxID=1892381 RepID=UPI003A890D6F
MSVSSSSGESGFVLPYVLVVIAVLSIVTLIAADRLQRSVKALDTLQAQSRNEVLLASAESEALYSLMTGTTVEGGVDINPESLIRTEFGYIGKNGEILNEQDVRDVSEPDVWGVNGEVRQSDAGQSLSQNPKVVYVALQDLSGVISLSNGSEENLQQLFESLGVSAEESRGLFAKLRDYSDADNNRTFRGGERADYRMKDKASPANSPLRNHEELSRILDWDSPLSEWDLSELKRLTTILPTNPLRERYLLPELSGIVEFSSGEDERAGGADFLESIATLSQDASNDTRLIFWVEKEGGLYTKRVVDVKRTSASLDVPFRKYWVDETTVFNEDLAFSDKSFDEIKDVIHPLSLQTQ